MTVKSVHKVQISSNQPNAVCDCVSEQTGWKSSLTRRWNHVWFRFTGPIPVRLKESDLLLLKTIYACDLTARLSWQIYRERGYCIEMLEGDQCSILTALRMRLHGLSPDDPAMEKLKGHFRYTWTTNKVQLKQFADGLAELAANGIDCIVLQDASLLAGSIDMADIKPLRAHSQGILVKPQDYLKALTVAKTKNLDLRICQHLIPGLNETVWTNAVPVSIAGYPARALSPPDVLLSHLLSAKLQTVNQAIWFADTVRLIKTCGSQQDIDRLMIRIEEGCFALLVFSAWRFFRELAKSVDADFDLGSHRIARALDTISVSTKEILQRTMRRMLTTMQQSNPASTD